MAYQDDYVMRTITDLVRAIAGLALGKNEIDYELPLSEAAYTSVDRDYRRLRDMVDQGNINGAENELYECLDTSDTSYLEMALAFYMYLNQLMMMLFIPLIFSERKLQKGLTVSALSLVSPVLRIS